jgi:hypothetical protein
MRDRTEEIFGPVIYSYTRKQALEDGEQIDVSTTAREAGIKFPVFLTRAVFEAYVRVPEGVTCQDEAGRLWDVVWMLRYGILRNPPGESQTLLFKLNVRNRGGTRLITLRASVGAMDIDDPAPAILVSLPDED